jgi:DNA-binding MarR family transcriptional regulator
MPQRIDVISEIASGCLAVRVRMLGRAISAIYDRAMSHHGVTISQVNIMVMVGSHTARASTGCSPSRVGSVLKMERSTVSRNIRALIDAGWLSTDTTETDRIRSLTLTPTGRKKVESLVSEWRQAQAAVKEMLGDPGVNAVMDLSARFGMSAAV